MQEKAPCHGGAEHRITFSVGEGDTIAYSNPRFFQSEGLLQNILIDPSSKKAFAGWSTEPSGSIVLGKEKDPSQFVPERDTTFYAVWKDAYVITFDAGEGYLDYDETLKTYQTTVGKGDSINCENIRVDIDENVKKVFVGWATDEQGKNCIDNSYAYIPTEDTTLYAVWGDACNVTFVTDEGVFPDDTQTQVFKALIGKPLYYIPDLYISGKEVRWATDPEGKGMIPDIIEFCPNRDTTLYAIIKDRITVYFDAGEAQFLDPEHPKRAYHWAAEGDTLYALHFNQEMEPPVHKVFTGWATDPEGKNLIEDEKTYEISDGEVFYAIWEEVKTVPVLQVDHKAAGKLKAVKVGEKIVDENDYIIRQEEGNVVIELTEAFKETLPADARITAEFDSGSYDGEVAAGDIMNYAILSLDAKNEDQEVQVDERSNAINGTADKVIIEASGSFDKLEKVMLDDVDLQRGVDYIATSGSTIITFTEEFLKNLKTNQEYSVTIVYSDKGTAKTSFVMEAAPEEEIKETEKETEKEAEKETEKETETVNETEAVKEPESEAIQETEPVTVKETQKETVKESETGKAKESEAKAEKGTASTKAVKTGDQTPLAILGIMMAVSGFTVVRILSKKRIRK